MGEGGWRKRKMVVRVRESRRESWGGWEGGKGE